MTPMSPEQIDEWKRLKPITRAECVTYKVVTPNGKIFVHRDMGVALSTQGRMGETQLGNFVDSISESLEGVG
jgi:hypothetical protein